MILVRRLVPAEVHDAEPRWSDPIPLNDERELASLPGGQWAIYAPTKGTVADAPEAENDLFKGWSFDRLKTVR
jgi:DNA gyrase inhibitor GyrI